MTPTDRDLCDRIAEARRRENRHPRFGIPVNSLELLVIPVNSCRNAHKTFFVW